jgi:hypothetical protein
LENQNLLLIFAVIKRFTMDNKQTKTDAEKLWDKVKLNSFYEPKGSDKFILYDETTSQKITEDGKKNLILLQEALKNVL